jgi:hypothetical protein
MRNTLLALTFLLLPTAGRADAILYTLTSDYSGINGFGPGSIIDWQLEVPTVLTTETDVTSLLSTTVGGGFSGCTISSVEIPYEPPTTGFTSTAVALFSTTCAGVDGASANFAEAITSLGTYTVLAKEMDAAIGTLTIADVPEPGVFALFGGGLLVISMLKRARP